VNDDEYKVIDNFVTSNLLVTTTKDAIADAKANHRAAVKQAALAKTAYEDLINKRTEARNAAQ